MSSFSLAEISKLKDTIGDRKRSFAASQDFKSLFELAAKAYNDDSWFINELIQNADDCKAKNVKIVMDDYEIQMEHDGKEFEVDDIDRVTKANSDGNPKATSYGTIGKFNLGFKSVFTITDSPHIKSGKFEFKIYDYVCLEVISPNFNSTNPEQLNVDFSKNTIIKLPFKANSEERKKVNINVIRDRLIKMSPKDILFLNHIENVTVIVDGEVRVISKSLIQKESNPLVESLSRLKNQLTINEDFSSCIQFIRLQSGFEYFTYFVMSGNLLKTDYNSDEEANFYRNIKVAYKLRNNNQYYEIVPEKEDSSEDTRLYVFFRTNTNTGLDFLIQGNYTVGMNRQELKNKHMDLDFDEINKKNINITVELIKTSILMLKDINLLSTQFIKILPLKESTNPIYNKIKEGIKPLLEIEPVWISSEGTFEKIDNLMLAENPHIIDIFNDNSFLQSNRWLHSDYIQFKAFLKNEMYVSIVDDQFVCNFIDKNLNYIITKCNEWLLKFYKYILNNEYYDTYKKNNIFKISNGDFINLLNKRKLFLSISDDIKKELEQIITDLDLQNEIYVLHEGVLDKNIIRIFIQKGIKDFKKEDLIQYILDEYFQKKDEEINKIEEYFKGFNLIIKLYSSNKEWLNRDFLKSIKEKIFLIGRTNEKYIKITGNAYWLNDNVQSLYGALQRNLSFVNKEIYYNRISENYHDILPRFMNDIGVCTNTFIINPTRTTDNNNFKFNSGNNNQGIFENRKKQKDFHRYYVTIYNPSILYIDSILSSLNDIHTSKAIFNLVREFIKEISASSNDYNNYRFKGWVKYYYRVHDVLGLDEIDVFTMLKMSKWLHVNGVFVNPSQVTISQLKEEGYIEDAIDSELNIMIDLLNISQDGSLDTKAKKIRDLLVDDDVYYLEKVKRIIDELIGTKQTTNI